MQGVALGDELRARLLGSTVVACLRTRGRAACQRCASCDQPHASAASLHRCLGVLSAFGLLPLVTDAAKDKRYAPVCVAGVAADVTAWMAVARGSAAQPQPS